MTGESPETGPEQIETLEPSADVLRVTRFTRMEGPVGRELENGAPPHINFYRRDTEAAIFSVPYSSDAMLKYFPHVKDQPPFTPEELDNVRQILIARVDSLASTDAAKQALKDRINAESSVQGINAIDDDIHAIEHAASEPTPDTTDAAIDTAPALPEEGELYKALFKFSKVYEHDPDDPENLAKKATVAPALRAAVTGSVENIWPALQERIQAEIPHPPAPAVLEDIWNGFDKASLNLRSAVPPAAAAAPAAAPTTGPAAASRAPRAADWRRERDQRINDAVSRVRELHLRDGIALSAAIQQAAGSLQTNDEFTFSQQLRKIPDVDKRTIDAALKQRADDMKDARASAGEAYAGRTPAEISASARRWQEENEKLKNS